MLHTINFISLALAFTISQSFSQTSALEFYDSTGTTPTTKFGWTGSATSGNFYIETPDDGNGVMLQKGNMSVDGNITAKKFVGDGSGLTGIVVTGPTTESVSAQLKSDASFLSSVKGTTGATGLQGAKGDKGDIGATGPAGTTTWSGITGKPNNGEYLPYGSTGKSTVHSNYGLSLSKNTNIITSGGATLNIENGSSGIGTQIINYGTGSTIGTGLRVTSPNVWTNETIDLGAFLITYLVGQYWAGWFNGDVKVSGKVEYGSLVQASDKKLKKNIVPIENSLKKILSINGVSYNYRSDEFPERKLPKEKQLGVIAQELMHIIPEVVSKTGEFYSVDYTKIIPVLIEAIKEQNTIIEKQATQINIQNNQILHIIGRLDKLKLK